MVAAVLIGVDPHKGSPSPGFLGYRAQIAVPQPRVMSKTDACLRPRG